MSGPNSIGQFVPERATSSIGTESAIYLQMWKETAPKTLVWT